MAVILTQVQEEFNPSRIEYVTMALYAGLITGATTWGCLADVIGRKLSWQITLSIAVSTIILSKFIGTLNCPAPGYIWCRSWSSAKLRSFMFPHRLRWVRSGWKVSFASNLTYQWQTNIDERSAYSLPVDGANTYVNGHELELY